ncbi:hypothetical protein [Vreelandella songnenensis]|nr:hypothetical protein [Halomonas songnenensis]
MLAGCGDNGDDDMPPAQQPESMDQAPEQEGSMMQEPTETSPIEQSSDSASSDTAVPQESMQPEDEARTNTVDDEPGFGEGTDPMPGANEADDDELTSGQ